MDWKKLVIQPHESIRSAMGVIDRGALQLALVAAENGKLLGTVSDGDIRRALLRGVSLDDAASSIMSLHPHVVYAGGNQAEALRLMRLHELRHIPVLDENHCIVDVFTLQNIMPFALLPNKVVLMAGGKGVRLGELTKNCPKPLLKVGSKPILETILEGFIVEGFHQFYISVNYHAQMIKDYFGDGSKWGVSITYLHEEKALGTGGALSLLPEPPEEPFFVMNGDILARLPAREIISAHVQQKSPATMLVKKHEITVPYGVIEHDANNRIMNIQEKPCHSFCVNAGIYVIDPLALTYIPRNTFYNMPDLFQELLGKGQKPTIFELNAYWLDIGQKADYYRANEEFFDLFSQ